VSKITYPFQQSVQFNSLQEIATCIYWLRLKMPFSLDHINVWLIEEPDGWILIDTGPDTEKLRASWQAVFSTQLKNKPIKTVICTHSHPDHLGLAGWVCAQHNAQVIMSKGEYEFYQHVFAKSEQIAQTQVEQFYQSAGADNKQVSNYFKHINGFGRLIHPVPENYQQLQSNTSITLGNYQWQVFVGKGHSPEHLCLFCQELNLLISGDQLLPTISPNVSVWPTAPSADPMNDFMLSCRELSELIDNNTLVLPAHGLPFYGGVNRLETLLSDTEQDLDKLYEFCIEPRKVAEVFPVLFKAEIVESNKMLAFGEALACLNMLLVEGRLTVSTGEDKINYYQQSR